MSIIDGEILLLKTQLLYLTCNRQYAAITAAKIFFMADVSERVYSKSL